jgi:hypothetical protein
MIMYKKSINEYRFSLAYRDEIVFLSSGGVTRKTLVVGLSPNHFLKR